MSGLAEDEMERSAGQRWGRAIGFFLLAVVVAGLVYLLKGLSNGDSAPKKQVTKISVLPDAPPPPPPPKEEIKPPKEVKEVKLEQPKPTPPQQVAEPTKMEGPAGDGPSAFQRGEVTTEYDGQKIGGPGGSSGGGGLQFAFFAKELQRHIQDELARNRKVKLGDYRVTVNLWIGADGALRRAELVGSSGNTETDRALRTALSELGPLRGAVPINLPQPIKLRITNRMMG